MEPIETFNLIFYVYIYKCQQVVGSKLLDEDYKPWWLTYAWIAFNVSYVFSCLYTFVSYDIDQFWKCLCCFPVSFQGLVKYGVFLRYYNEMREKVVILYHIYKVNKVHGTENYKVLGKWSKICLFVCKFGTVSILVSFMFFIPYTMVFNIITGNHDPIMPIFVWGFDESTYFGYAALSFYHFFALCLGSAGTICADMLLLMLVLHMFPMTEILSNMFDQINVALKNQRQEGNLVFDRYFRNILLVHKETCSYISGIAHIYYYTSMCEVYTDACTMCVGIYCILSIQAVQLYPLIGMSFFKFLLFCFLGTIIETTTDKMYATITKSDWYLMPQKQKQMMILMIARAQNPSIMMAGTIPLNLDTFVNVMKTVYTVGMILMETVEQK